MCDIKNIANLISLKHSTTSSKYFDIRDESAILYNYSNTNWFRLWVSNFKFVTLLVKLNIGLEYCFIIVLLIVKRILEVKRRVFEVSSLCSI